MEYGLVGGKFKDSKWCRGNSTFTEGVTYGTSVAPTACPSQIP